MSPRLFFSSLTLKIYEELWVILFSKMAAVSVRNFRNFFSGKRTLVVLRTGFKSSIPCMAILNRPYCESSSQSVPDTLKERSPTIKRSPLFSGQKITPKRFQLSFEEFQQLRRKLRTKQKLAGLPIGVTFLLASSTITAYMFPNIFDATPEQIEPILYVKFSLILIF